ncbi:MAG: alpha-2-macroglobulin family protein [Patescibacteria group bacterium]|nr:hypothetical protein [Patescibacteria group bacterium]
MNNLEKNLKTLGEMRKKRGNSDFRLDLRNKLMRKANEMQAKDQKSKTLDQRSKIKDSRSKIKNQREWNFAPFFKKALVPAMAGALLVAISFYALLPGGATTIIPGVQLVDIAQAQDYYVLEPLDKDPSGIDASAGFRLESKGEVSAEDVDEVLVINPYAEVKVEQESDNSVIITPVLAMEANEIYSIELDGKVLKGSPYPMEYSWAYQVSDQFRLRGTLPADQETSIPINSGIEFLFNFRGVLAEDLTEHFTIDPYLPGHFEVIDKTAAYVHDGLLEETIYTLTLTAGLSLGDSENTLQEDYTFQFETSSEAAFSNVIRLRNGNYNFSPEDEPYFTMTRFDWIDEGNNYIDYQVYAYPSADAFLEAMQEMDSAIPTWSYRASKNYEIPTDSLELVLDQKDIEVYESNYSTKVFTLPDTLDEGYYLLKASAGDDEDTAFFQVSSLSAAVYITEDLSLVWVNDVVTGESISGAQVEVVDSSISEKTGSDGVALLEGVINQATVLQTRYNYRGSYMEVSYGGETTFYDLRWYNNDYAEDDYWMYFDTERTTYHPTDDIHYWGFLKGRYGSAAGEYQITLSSRGWFYSTETTTFYEETIYVEDGGTFEGKLEIELMPPGFYSMSLKKDGETLSTLYLDIEDFVKPAYKLDAQADEDILFAWETTDAYITSEFFEGTPVPNLALNFDASGDTDGTYTTDEDGELTVEFKADPGACNNKYCSLFKTRYFEVFPTLEESGDINATERFTVIRSFVGATDVEAELDGLYLETKWVDREKVRDADYLWADPDIYSEIAPETQVNLKIVKSYYEKTDNGTYYDYINKVVKPKYSYSSSKETIEEVTLHTDENGVLDYPLDLEDGYSYYFYMTIIDPYGNEYIEYESIYNSRYSYNYGDYLSFDGVEDSYSIGDEVEFTLTSGDEDSLPDDGSYQYLFVSFQDGLRDYIVSDSPTLAFEFTEDMAPNINYMAVRFDGDYYTNPYTSTTINYDYEDERLDVDIVPTSNDYGPGDDAQITVAVTDAGTDQAAQSYVNVYMVDEAYYALYAEYFSDPLISIYDNVHSGVERAYVSHEGPIADEGGKGGCFVEGTEILMSDGSTKVIEEITTGDMILTREDPLNDRLVEAPVAKLYKHHVSEYILVNGELGVTQEHVVFLNGQWRLAGDIKVGDYLVDADGEEVTVTSVEYIYGPVNVYNFEVELYHTYFADGYYVHNDKDGGVRENFEDTALFEVVQTDANGQAVIDFTLPDNITSWRVVAVAISEDLRAGYSSENIDVSKEVFVLPVINDEYLTGDKPIIPVRVYGDSLNADSEVNVGLEIESMNYDEEKNANAYDVTYFELDELSEGEHRSVAYTDGDAMATTFDVKDSHFVTQEIWTDILGEKLSLEGSDDQRTLVSFMNNETGTIYKLIVDAAYHYAGRADQSASKNIARQLLNEYFDETHSVPDFDAFLYQNVPDQWDYNSEITLDGGIGVLTYDSSRLSLTAQLAGLDASLWSQEPLRRYFENIFESNEYTLSEKILALYGLSALGDSVLIDLNYFVENYELDTGDKVYAALAYLEMGDKASATDLFLDLTENYTDLEGGRTKIADDSRDNELSWTASMAVIAAELGSDYRDYLWDFVLHNDKPYEDDRSDLIIVEKILYAKTLLENGASAEVSFSLNGEKIELVGNDYYKVSMLPDELDAAEFSSIEGDTRVFTFYEAPQNLDDLELDSSLAIGRNYYTQADWASGFELSNDSFKTGDLVKVEFTVDVDLKGGYSIIDLLPSGLQPTTQKSNQNERYTDGFRHPYKIEGQKMYFGLYCGDTTCNGEPFYYYARVINPGEFRQEPAVIQNTSNPNIMNVSGDNGIITILQ